MLNIVGNPIKDININLPFLSSRWKVVEWIPLGTDIWWKFWKFYFSMYSTIMHTKLPYHFFPICWGPFQDVNLLYFLLKMQIWNGCNVLNIVANPIKNINVNLSFLSSRQKVVEWTPQDWKIFWMYFWVQDEKLWNGPTQDWKIFWMHFWVQDLKLLNGLLRSDIWWKLWKFYLAMYSPMIHADLPIHFFPISWGPFQDVNLLYFLLKMQIWNGCNVLNIVETP